MDQCITCGGAIPEHNMSYGYSGKWCGCLVTQKIQRPASKEIHHTHLGVWANPAMNSLPKLPEMVLKSELTALESENARLREALKLAKELYLEMTKDACKEGNYKADVTALIIDTSNKHFDSVINEALNRKEIR